MKINIVNILKISIIVLIILWVGLLTFDYIKAQNNQKPLICLSEKNIELSAGSYYVCNSFGYKYYEYKAKNGESGYGFGAIFVKNDIEKKLGV